MTSRRLELPNGFSRRSLHGPVNNLYVYEVGARSGLLTSDR